MSLAVPRAVEFGRPHFAYRRRRSEDAKREYCPDGSFPLIVFLPVRRAFALPAPIPSGGTMAFQVSKSGDVMVIDVEGQLIVGIAKS